MRNCDGKTPTEPLTARFAFAPGLERCPWSMTSRDSSAYVELWTEWRNLGTLPYPGDLLEQPAFIHQAIRTCELISIETQNKQVRRQQADLEQQAEAAKRAAGGRRG